MKTITKERRGDSTDISDSLEQHLNRSQLFELHQIENFGWSLKYVRRPLFMEPIPIVFHKDIRSYAVLEVDGTLNRNSDVVVRNPF